MAKAAKKTKKKAAVRKPQRKAARTASPARANGGGNAAAMTDKLSAFLYDYIDSIDSDRLEAWPEYFTQKCIYKIIPRENVERNLPISLVYCDNKGMLIDRVVSLRKANVYNLHYEVTIRK